MRSAALLQLVIVPCRSLLMIASLEPSMIAANKPLRASELSIGRDLGIMLTGSSTGFNDAHREGVPGEPQQNVNSAAPMATVLAWGIYPIANGPRIFAFRDAEERSAQLQEVH